MASSGLRFCANISMMFTEANTSLPERYSMAQRAGFAAVEAAFPYTHTIEELSKARAKAGGMQQVLINVEPGAYLGYAALDGKEKEFMFSLEKGIEYCKAMNCKLLHIMSGKVSESNPGSEKTLRSNLALALPLLAENDIVGLIEPINPYSVPGYFLNNFEFAAKIVEDLNSPNLRLQLDLFHLQFIKGDLTNNVKKFLPITGHIQIAQVPDRHEPNSAGEIQYSYVFDLLQQLEYKGWIGLEYKPKEKTETGLTWVKEMGQSLENKINEGTK